MPQCWHAANSPLRMVVVVVVMLLEENGGGEEASCRRRPGGQEAWVHLCLFARKSFISPSLGFLTFQ